MEDAGAVTYNIQSAINEVEDISFRSTIKKQKELVQATLKTVSKVEEKKEVIKNDLSRPLLLNFDSDEPGYKDLVSNEEKKSASRTPRKTPRDLTPQND